MKPENKKEARTKMDKVVYSAQDIADVMGYSLPKTYELMRAEDFPTCRIGKRMFVPISLFNRWLEEHAGK